jgi:hypothetical protein
MSLYNMVAGYNPSTEQLLNLINLTPGSFGRYRDVYVEGDYIVVHTRCGGGNRDDYEDMFDAVSLHPWYSHDEDCDFDCTYADIYFKIPEDQTKTIVGLLDKGIPPTEMWNKTFEATKG